MDLLIKIKCSQCKCVYKVAFDHYSPYCKKICVTTCCGSPCCGSSYCAAYDANLFSPEQKCKICMKEMEIKRIRKTAISNSFPNFSNWDKYYRSLIQYQTAFVKMPEIFTLLSMISGNRPQWNELNNVRTHRLYNFFLCHGTSIHMYRNLFLKNTRLWRYFLCSHFSRQGNVVPYSSREKWERKHYAFVRMLINRLVKNGVIKNSDVKSYESYQAFVLMRFLAKITFIQ